MIRTEESRIEIPGKPGSQLFVKQWIPESKLETAPILLFHDSLGSVKQWRDFPEKLSQATQRRVVAYDRLGFGRSSARTVLPTPDFISLEATEIVPHIVDQLGIDQFIVCGHSVGGGMAVETTAHHSTKVIALITIAAQAFVEDRTIKGILDAKKVFGNPESVARLSKYHGEKSRWILNAWMEVWLAPNYADWSLDDAIAKIDAPSLIVHGENDEYGSVAHPNRIGNGRTNASIEILSNIGHVPNRECPEILLGLITEFLEKQLS